MIINITYFLKKKLAKTNKLGRKGIRAVEKLIVMLLIILAIAVITKKIIDTMKNPVCDSCYQQCPGCQMAEPKKIGPEPTVINIEGLK